MTQQYTFTGRWDLLPELSLYELGPLPASGTYEIFVDGGHVNIELSWTMEDGVPQSATYGGAMDGSRSKIEAPGVDELSFECIDQHTLDSSAYADGQRVSYARRAVSRDGLLMTTVQEGPNPSGGTFRNFQVYRRKEQANG